MNKLIHQSVGIYRADDQSQHAGKLFLCVTVLDEHGGRNSRDVPADSILGEVDAAELERLYEVARESAAAKL